MKTPLRSNARRCARLEDEIRRFDGRVAFVVAICFVGITLMQALA